MKYSVINILRTKFRMTFTYAHILYNHSIFQTHLIYEHFDGTDISLKILIKYDRYMYIFIDVNAMKVY